MYSPNRSGQINHVKRLLNNDGIFIFTEKHSSEHDEYQKEKSKKIIHSNKGISRKMRLTPKRKSY